jgi:ferredoxin-type protein NapH
MSDFIQIGGTRRVGPEVRELEVPEKAALAAVTIGAVLLLVALAAPGRLAGWLSPWVALVGTFGLTTVGGSVYFWLAYKDTTPGIKNHGVFHSSLLNRRLWGWVAGIGITTFYVLLYWHAGRLEGAIRLLDPVAKALSGKAADQWFLYGTLYTGSVLVFGLRMALKYRHNRYQLLRTASVAFFQLGFAFVLPNLLKKMNQPDFYFTYWWPLKPDYLLPFDYVMGESGIAAATWSGTSVGRFMLLWGAVMALIGTPVLTWFFGKRWYCSWVCGCGGLAETLGDPWRQLSDKSTKAWRFERWSIHSVLVLIVGLTVFLWANDLTGRRMLGDDGSGLFWKSYGFFIVMAFSGVIGVGFYPLMGSRVWCRFGCPQAAILGLFQRFFSRFRITTNGGQCISCGNCSTYCEMGIDVRAYAQRGENIVRASCVGCGVCAAVCPRGVLKLENGSVGDRFPGADKPLQAIGDAIRGGPKPG